MDLTSVNIFDLLVALGLFAAFVIGFIQGAIRRLLGIGSMVFAFLLASTLRDPFGNWLGDNWTQFPRAYSVLIGYGVLFVVFVAAFSIVIQGFYKRTNIYAKTPIVDEVVGGLLGVLEAVLLLGFVIIIVDSFPFGTTAPFSGELGFVRSLFNAIDGSQTQAIFRNSLIPGFFLLVGGFVPSDIVSAYRH